MHGCMCVHVCICLYVCMCVYVCLRVCVYVYVHVYAYVHACMHAYMYVCGAKHSPLTGQNANLRVGRTRLAKNVSNFDIRGMKSDRSEPCYKPRKPILVASF